LGPYKGAFARAVTDMCCVVKLAWFGAWSRYRRERERGGGDREGEGVDIQSGCENGYWIRGVFPHKHNVQC